MNHWLTLGGDISRRSLIGPGLGALASLVFLLAGAALAAGLPQLMQDGGAAIVVAVTDGDTLTLDDGREVRLVGIQAPKLPLDRPGFVTWPLAEAAKSALEARALGKTVRLAYGGAHLDRYGRTLAHLYLDDGTWVQGAMLEAGMARVYSFADNRALVPAMLALEGGARREKRGVWADPYYAIVPAERVRGQLDRFALVEGKVLSARVVDGRGYLNFGPDYRSDFTVSIASSDRREFERAGFAIPSYAGRRVRVRGWVELLNGPMIEATHPEQIEILGE
ncbi:MAG: thermonuclease family protein [Alphaproteobacteria bacterium]|nr:thermonuclease family protein [Alphaproteobacteria bacterium]